MQKQTAFLNALHPDQDPGIPVLLEELCAVQGGLERKLEEIGAVGGGIVDGCVDRRKL